MKAPAFVKLKKWGQDTDLTKSFKVGETVCLSFGRKRSREIEYVVDSVTVNRMLMSRRL